MSQELSNDQDNNMPEDSSNTQEGTPQQEHGDELSAWWEEQSFEGKEHYSLDEAGTLTLKANGNMKERVIATLAAENAAATLKNLQDKFVQLHNKVTDTEAEWVAAEDKLKMADKAANIKDTLQQISAVGNYGKIAPIVEGWDKVIHELVEENYAAKLKLTEMAEVLSANTDFKDTALALRDIGEKWKQTGYVDKQRNDKLWNRMEAARKTFHDRKRVHHEEEEKDLLVNLDLKIDLVEQAESIAQSKEWKKTTETFHRLTEEWKTIGHTLNKKNEELWQRFQAAKSIFFERKREHFSHIQVEQEANFITKTALAEKAEALRESRDWNATAQAFAALMEEWKKTGRVPQEKGDELWKRFTEAQEQFFSAKKQHTDTIRAVHDTNYEQKAALLARAENAKNSTRWGDTTAEMNELLEEWKKIGPIAREHGNKMWEDFIGARKYFFARKDANRDERKQYYVEQKVVRAEQAKDLVVKMVQDIKEEEEKLVDFKAALDNITPGKKAGELRAHLEKLIADSTKQIKRLQEKHAAVQAEMLAAPAQQQEKGDRAPKEKKERNNNSNSSPRGNGERNANRAATAQQEDMQPQEDTAATAPIAEAATGHSDSNNAPRDNGEGNTDMAATAQQEDAQLLQEDAVTTTPAAEATTGHNEMPHTAEAAIAAEGQPEEMTAKEQTEPYK